MNTIQKGSTMAALRALVVIVGLSLLVMVMTACGTMTGAAVWGLEVAQLLERLREMLRKGHLLVPVSAPRAAPSTMQPGKGTYPDSRESLALSLPLAVHCAQAMLE